jgi:hypothetical protein
VTKFRAWGNGPITAERRGARHLCRFSMGCRGAAGQTGSAPFSNGDAA